MEFRNLGTSGCLEHLHDEWQEHKRCCIIWWFITGSYAVSLSNPLLTPRLDRIRYREDKCLFVFGCQPCRLQTILLFLYQACPFAVLCLCVSFFFFFHPPFVITFRLAVIIFLFHHSLSGPLLKCSRVLGCIRAGGSPQVDPHLGSNRPVSRAPRFRLPAGPLGRKGRGGPESSLSFWWPSGLTDWPLCGLEAGVLVIRELALLWTQKSISPSSHSLFYVTAFKYGLRTAASQFH